MNRILALAAAFALLAGCNAPADDTDTQTTSSEAPSPAEVVALRSSGCQGYHTFFASPAELFVDFVPENFTMATDSSGNTVNIPVFGYDCQNGTSDLWALLPVVPPEQYRNTSYSVDAVVLQGFTTNATYQAQYVAWGFDAARVLAATVSEREATLAGVARDDRFALGTATVKYEVRTTVQQSGGAFDEAHYRYWITNGTQATGWVEVSSLAATNVGPGTATFQSQGDPGAPPASVGIGHRIEDASLVVTAHKLA